MGGNQDWAKLDALQLSWADDIAEPSGLPQPAQAQPKSLASATNQGAATPQDVAADSTSGQLSPSEPLVQHDVAKDTQSAWQCAATPTGGVPTVPIGLGKAQDAAPGPPTESGTQASNVKVQDHALLAAHVYGQVDGACGTVLIHSDQNSLPLPQGWTVVPGFVRDDNDGPVADDHGFLASVYSKGDEIVIAYAGTTVESCLDWFQGNIPARIGPTLTATVHSRLEVLDGHSRPTFAELAALNLHPSRQIHAPTAPAGKP